MATFTSNRKRVKRKVKYPGIVKDARSLGVTRTALFYALEGKRALPTLVRRYRALKESQQS